GVRTAIAAPLVEGGLQVQRWRYARPVEVHPARCLAADGLPGLVFAGDAFGGAKVEGAVLSGRAAAHLLG
ncbi:MAG: FAD-dependent oxidoreductase, partial [Ilumatobacteraceae bacterium]